MGLALSGLASGFDWKSIVDQLIEVSRAPQNRMRSEKSALSTKTSALNEVKGLLSSLKSSLSSLSSTEALQKKSATFRDTTTDWTASVDSKAASGTYEFTFHSPATASKLTGASNIANQLATGATLSNLPVGRTITGGIFTVNGVQISKIDPENGQRLFDPVTGAPVPFTTADTLDDILLTINALSGVTASYNAVTDQIDLVKGGGGSISLGASNDTSNFLQAMRLSSGSSPVSSSTTLSSPRLTGSIDSANLAGWSGTGVSDSIIINGKPIEYNSATDSIQTLLNRINSSSAGVTATYDLASGRFLLTNKQTGNVGISVQDGRGAGGLAEAMGLTSGTLTSGADAVFSVNGGGNLTSRSNTLDESVHGISGLSVTANSVGTETVTVGSDPSVAKGAINSFIEKYNAVQNAIEKYTKITVDGEKVSSAVLAGNREMATISRELRRILYAAGNDENEDPLEGTVKRLSDLGIDFAGIENTISIKNSATLDSRLASNADDVIKYFATTKNGLVDRLDSMLGRLVNDHTTSDDGVKITGTFKVQLDSISKQNKSLDKQIEEFERRLESQRSLLESSFIAMEKAQSGFQQQSAYLAKTFSGNSK